jgi:uncharacterized membrane protein (UPF0136 family)
MSAGNANLINAITLIGMGMWGYKVTNSPTALIPVFFGAALLVMTNFIRVHHKVVSHIAVVLTLIVLVAIAGRILPKAISSNDSMKMLRAGSMTLTGVIALIAFIKSFIDAKKARTKAGLQK